MKVIDRLAITPEMVTTTAINAHADWAIGTTYAEGDRRVYQQHIYESLQSANTGRQPDTEPTWWIRVGPSNQWAAFDTALNTITTADSPLSITVTPGQVINSAALLNLNGTAVQVEVYDGETQVFDRTYSLDGTVIVDWYMYFFEPYDLLTEVVITDLPPYSAGELVVKLSGSATVSIGAVVIGTVYEIGDVQYGVGFGIRDYSVKQEDEFGNLTLQELDYAKRMDPQVMVENSRLRFVSKLLTKLRAKPTVFIGSEDPRYLPLIVFGVVRDWNVEIPYPNQSLMRLEITGLI